ncbi:MAG: hypothetical protein QM648_11490 [Solirubrobacterales bacterium]
MEAKTVSSDSVRVPTPKRGESIHIMRYNDERAVILHPQDFRELESLADLVREICAPRPRQMSDVAIAAHIEEETPGTPITDPAELHRLFG